MSKQAERSRPTRVTGNARVGGRSERVVRDVLNATIVAVGTQGYANLGMEEVATNAGVNKTTVYRRWPTKAELVSAAVRAVADRQEALPDTGSLREDLVTLIRHLVAFVRTPEGRAITRLVTTERGDPEIDELARSMKERSFERRKQLVDRAKARGEIPADVDARLLLDAIMAPVFSRVIRFDEHVPDADIIGYVDLVVTGAEHGGGRRSPPSSTRTVGGKERR